MSKPVIVLGAGGHASVLVDILQIQGRKILAVVSPAEEIERPIFDGLRHYKSDDKVLEYKPDDIELVNGLGSLPGQTARFDIYEKFRNLNYTFSQIISSDAVVSSKAMLSQGVQVLPGVIINVGASVGENTIVNTGSIIEHDCIIGAHNHIAPGVTLSGEVITGVKTHIGTGANVIQRITIGDDVVVGAGAVVSKNIPKKSILYGYRNDD